MPEYLLIYMRTHIWFLCLQLVMHTLTIVGSVNGSHGKVAHITIQHMHIMNRMHNQDSPSSLYM